MLARFGSAPRSSSSCAELVVAVVDRRQQRRPAVLGGLVDVGAGVEQRLRRFDVAFARREDQRRQAAAAAADQAGDDDLVVVVVASLRGLRGSAGAPLAPRHAAGPPACPPRRVAGRRLSGRCRGRRRLAAGGRRLRWRRLLPRACACAAAAAAGSGWPSGPSACARPR